MITQMFSVFDKAVSAFLPPFFARSKGEAIRSFSDACNDTKHQFFSHAMDYSLVSLGEFDDASGVVVGHEPVRVISAVECIAATVDDVAQAAANLDPPVRPRAVKG